MTTSINIKIFFQDLELEIFTYRIICLNQINCESCRMNSTVSSETVVLTVDGAPVRHH